ncbi:unnamed protein product [Effrenium voratum]|nr:unnamed protein product [Effrenium voratum]
MHLTFGVWRLHLTYTVLNLLVAFFIRTAKRMGCRTRAIEPEPRARTLPFYTSSTRNVTQHITPATASAFEFPPWRPKDAKPYYEKALRLLQNNPKVLTEVILYHDLVLQHPSFSSALVQRRAKSSKAGELSLLQLKGPGVGTLMCEAAVAAKSGGQAKLALQLWQRAQELAPLGNCVRNNWPIINDERAEDNSYARQYSTWAKVRMAAAGGVSLEIGPHHLVNVRFLEDDDLTLWPPKNKTSW